MKVYTNDIYPFALALSFSDKELEAEYTNAANEDGTINTDPSAAATTVFLNRKEKRGWGDSAVGIVFKCEKPSPRLITHEALHAAYFMLQIGMNTPLNDYTEEPYAYLAGWIASCCDKFINENNKPKHQEQ